MLVDVIKTIIPLSFFESTPDGISFQEPYAPLFQYSKDIFQELASRISPSSDTFRDFYALESFLENHEGYGIVWKSLDLGNQTVVSFDNLWALFRTGGLIVTQDRLEEKRLFKCTRIEEDVQGMGFQQHFCVAMNVHFWYIVWNPGEKRFRQKSQYVKIKRFAGHRKVTSLPVYPLWYENEDARNSLLVELQSRGEKWSDLISSPPSCFEHFGQAIAEEEGARAENSDLMHVSLFLPAKFLLIG